MEQDIRGDDHALRDQWLPHVLHCTDAGRFGSGDAARAGPSPYASIAQLQQQLDAGTLDSAQLTQLFTARIQQLDRSGPMLRAVIEINPDAVTLAATLDAARAQAPARSALYGLPLLLKDNIDTADRMRTSAGSLALTQHRTARRPAWSARLRDSGRGDPGQDQPQRVGQLPLHACQQRLERARRADPQSVRARPQPVRIELRLRRGRGRRPGRVAAIGTETDGSIICPAAMNGIVGIKPTLGLVSRSGIVPISHSQDTAGPMARSVADAAALLTVIAGSDPRDPATADADAHATDYTHYLAADALRGKRIGVVRALAGYRPDVDQLLAHSIATLRAAGADRSRPRGSAPSQGLRRRRNHRAAVRVQARRECVPADPHRLARALAGRPDRLEPRPRRHGNAVVRAGTVRAGPEPRAH